MLSFGLSAVVLGGLANVWMALLNFEALKHLSDPAKPVPGRGVLSRNTLRLTTIRNIYVYVLFAALSFGFPHALVTTGLGTGVSAGIFGFLLIQTLVVLLTPEGHQPHWSTLPWSTGVGAACYACSVYAGLNI